MTINFECGNCGKQLSTSDDKAGKTGKCPDCGEPVTVPQPEVGDEFDDLFNLETPAATPAQTAGSGLTQTCPMCGAQAPAAASNCPHCGEELRESGRARRSEDRFSTGNKIDLGLVLSTAWNRFTQQPGAAIGGLFITALAMFGIVILGAIAYAIFFSVMWRTSLGLTILAGIVTYLGFYAAGIWLQLGLTRFFISLARGHRADFSLLFSGGKFILRAALCGLLIALIALLAYFALLAAIVAAGMVGGRGAAFVAGLIAIILIIRVMMSFLWTFHVLVDIDARDVSAVFLSRDLMAGNYLTVFLILFLTGLIPMAPAAVLILFAISRLGVLILAAIFFVMLIEIFVVIPFVNMIGAVTYDHLSGGRDRRPGDVD